MINLKNKLVIGVIVGSLTLTGAYSAFAESEAASPSTNRTTFWSVSDDNISMIPDKSIGMKEGRFEFRMSSLSEDTMVNDAAMGNFRGRVVKFGNFDSQFDFSKLVEDGIIDQATADAATEFMTKKSDERKAEMDKLKDMSEEERKAYFEDGTKVERFNVFDELITAGILTEEQVTAIKESFEAMRPFDNDLSGAGRIFKLNLRGIDTSKLVEDGTIDQATADAIDNFMAQKSEEMEAEMDKMKNMTEEERKAYFENKEEIKKVNLFDELIAAGILTEEQAATIKENCSVENFNEGFGDKGRGFNVSLRGINASKLVEDGIIDQATADAIDSFMAQKTEEMKAEMDKMKNMTEEERKSYFGDKQVIKKVNLFDELIAAGIITEEQSSTISQYFKASDNRNTGNEARPNSIIRNSNTNRSADNALI